MIQRAEPTEKCSGRYVFHSYRGELLTQITLQLLRRRIAFTKPQPLVGALGQMAAALSHSMTPDRLGTVSASVPKVLILSAAEDVTIPYKEGEKLQRYMPEAEYQCWEKTGHGICGQYKKRFNQLLERVFAEGSGRDGC